MWGWGLLGRNEEGNEGGIIDLSVSYRRIEYIHGLKSSPRRMKAKGKLNLRIVEPTASSTKLLAKNFQTYVDR